MIHMKYGLLNNLVIILFIMIPFLVSSAQISAEAIVSTEVHHDPNVTFRIPVIEANFNKFCFTFYKMEFLV